MVLRDVARSRRALSGERVLFGAAVLLASFLVAFVSASVFMAHRESFAEDREVDVDLAVNSMISVTTDAVDDTLNIPVVPISAGAESKGIINVYVDTNNVTGYTLAMNTDSETTALVHTADSTSTIPSSSLPIGSPGALAANTWGYSNWTDAEIDLGVGPTIFYRIPPLSSPDILRTTSQPALMSRSSVTFGVKVDLTKKQGTYQNTVVFTAITNPTT